MVNFSPPLAFVPPPPPLFPPVVAPVFTPPGPAVPPPGDGLPVFLQPLPLPSFGPVPVEFSPSGVPPLPLPSDFFQPGPEVVPFVPPPFEGGQCPSVLYSALFRSTRSNGQVQERFINGNPGPITGFSLTSEGVSWIVRVFHSAGSNQLAVESTTLPAPDISNFRVVRADGQPDNCGSLPPVQEGERVPNPARNFVPSPLFVPQPAFPIPVVLPDINPTPKAPPLPPLPQSPDPDPARRPDRRVPGPPLPIGPVTPPEVVPFAPGTIPSLPTFPQIVPTRTPQPPRFPQLPPLIEPVPPTTPTRPPQFPPLPPEAPTKQTPPVIVVPPPLTRIPPPVNNDCCAVPEVIRQGAALRRLIEQLRDRMPEDCTDLCEPAVMLDIVCQGGLGTPITTAEQAVTVLDLSSALGRLSRQVFEIAQYLNICDTFTPPPGAGVGDCGPGVVGPVVFAGQPGGNGEDISFGDPPEGEAWVGAIARYVASSGVGAVPSPVAPNRAYTQVVGNVSLRYGVARGKAQQVRSEWNEVIRPVGAPYATGVYVAAIPQSFVTIFPVSVTIDQ